MQCPLGSLGWLVLSGLNSCLPGCTKSLDAFRTSIVPACWPRKLPVSDPDAVLGLVIAPDGCDPAFLVIWGRFRQMKRFLVYRPGKCTGSIAHLTWCQVAVLHMALSISFWNLLVS